MSSQKLSSSIWMSAGIFECTPNHRFRFVTTFELFVYISSHTKIIFHLKYIWFAFVGEQQIYIEKSSELSFPTTTSFTYQQNNTLFTVERDQTSNKTIYYMLIRIGVGIILLFAICLLLCQMYKGGHTRIFAPRWHDSPGRLIHPMPKAELNKIEHTARRFFMSFKNPTPLFNLLN